jgi:hypothetical protein
MINTFPKNSFNERVERQHETGDNHQQQGKKLMTSSTAHKAICNSGMTEGLIRKGCTSQAQ